jgi:hypothetical protein
VGSPFELPEFVFVEREAWDNDDGLRCVAVTENACEQLRQIPLQRGKLRALIVRAWKWRDLAE